MSVFSAFLAGFMGGFIGWFIGWFIGKRLRCAAIICAALALAGCYQAETPAAPVPVTPEDPTPADPWTGIGKSSSFRVIEVEGHRYVILAMNWAGHQRAQSGISALHAESCPCRGTGSGSR